MMHVFTCFSNSKKSKNRLCFNLTLNPMGHGVGTHTLKIIHGFYKCVLLPSFPSFFPSGITELKKKNLIQLAKYKLELTSRLLTLEATVLFFLSFFPMKRNGGPSWNCPSTLYNGKLLWLWPQLHSVIK